MPDKITCFLADDEPLAREGLARYISRIDYLDLKGEFEDALQLDAALHEKHAIDLIFLDIEMPLISGVDYLRSMTQAPAVILTTAYEQYAVEGYELNVVDYLLKPISFTRFMQAASKARDHILNDRRPVANPGYTFIRSGKQRHKINFADIRWVEAIENYVKIVTADRTLITRTTMKGIADLLSTPNFIRIHKSVIVNMDHVLSIEGSMLHLSDRSLTISRNFRSDFENYLDKNYPRM